MINNNPYALVNMVVHDYGVHFGMIQQDSRWAVYRVMGNVK